MTDTGAADDIVTTLFNAFKGREGVFADTGDLLENQIPDGVAFGSREHVNFLFYLIGQDHGVKSAKLYAKAKALYGKCPQLFEPGMIIRQFSDVNCLEIADSIGVLGLRYPRNASRAWLYNSRMLAEQYDCDARRIVSGTDAMEIMKRIREFKGFGPKTGGLLFRVLVGIGVAHPDNAEAVSFPTDIHDTRIAALTKIADIPPSVTEKTYVSFVPRAELAWRAACSRRSLDWLVVDRALWILGSRGCSTDRHHDCPIRKHCIRGGESSDLFSTSVIRRV